MIMELLRVVGIGLLVLGIGQGGWLWASDVKNAAAGQLAFWVCVLGLVILIGWSALKKWGRKQKEPMQ